MLGNRLGVVTSLALACLGAEPRAQSEAAPDEGGASPVSGATIDDGDWIDVVWPGEDEPAAGDYVRVGGLFTLDLINWDSGNDEHDGFETRALSLLLSGRLGEASYFVDVDLEGENTRHNLREAWMEGRLGEAHWVRAGWLRVAHGTELATRAEDLPHVGYGFTSWENGRFGPGVSVDGYALPWLWWQGTATAGHDTDLAGSNLGEPQGLLRVVAQPERDADGAFEGFFGGVSISKTTDLDGPVHVETPFQQTSFATIDLDGDSRRFWAGELGYRRGGFRFGAEMSDGEVSGVEQPGGGPDQDYDEIGRYMVWAAYNLRGPAPVWSRGRWLPYDLGPGDELPLELAVRYSNADINRDFFTDGLTSFGPSVNEARTITVTASLYLQPTTRLSAALLDTVSDQVSSHWGEGDVSYLLRLDQRF